VKKEIGREDIRFAVSGISRADWTWTWVRPSHLHIQHRASQICKCEGVPPSTPFLYHRKAIFWRRLWPVQSCHSFLLIISPFVYSFAKSKKKEY
jgi:hypothetical protein